jgi:hypothetical protein
MGVVGCVDGTMGRADDIGGGVDHHRIGELLPLPRRSE